MRWMHGAALPHGFWLQDCYWELLSGSLNSQRLSGANETCLVDAGRIDYFGDCPYDAAWGFTRREIWLGMLGPLISAIASWIVMERQHRQRPQGMTRLLIKAFAAKMIFFGIYIAVFLVIELVRPIPFRHQLCGVLHCSAYSGSDWIAPSSDCRAS